MTIQSATQTEPAVGSDATGIAASTSVSGQLHENIERILIEEDAIQQRVKNWADSLIKSTLTRSCY